MTTELNSDCLNLIFDELINDRKSLHSCLLVNKRWCNVVVPILWKKHAWSDCIDYLREVKKRRLFKTLLTFLPSSSKQLLSDNEISVPPIPETSPTFNYISFCNFPENEIIKVIIRAIFKKIKSDDKKKILEQEIYKLFISQCKNIREIHLQTTQPLTSFPGASECFSQLYSLRIDMKFVNSEIIHGMTQLCKDLSSLSIYSYSKDNLELISLINSQKKNLKELYIYATDDDDIEELKQCLANSEFPNLKILGVTGLKCFKELAMLVEKTKGNISRIYVYTTDKLAKDPELLIQAVSKNCPNIKFLRTYIEPKGFNNLKSVLLNCKHLEKLRLDNINIIRSWYDEEDTGDELLNILTEFAPDSLINITLSEDWKFSIDALTRFFESYRVRTLNEFDIIHRSISNITSSHCDIVKKYINEGIIKRSNCTIIKTYSMVDDYYATESDISL